ncbi:MAG: RHS repeat-associated core domain-containing protein [Alphaproteobacteria bacterium]
MISTSRMHLGNATSFTSTHYPSGGLYSFNSTYNTSNQMTVANGNALIYDPYGNLVTHTNYRSFKYDAENRLIEVDFPAAPADKVEMQYDGLGRRTQIKSTIGGVVTTRNLQWCAQTTSPPFQGAAEEICVERDASGGMQRMVYPEGEYRANGDRYFYERDQTGNIRDVMKMAAGLTTAARDSSFNYTPYGGVDGRDGTAEPLQQFAGLLYEKNSNLFLSRTRAYAPWIGRWLQRDPIGQNGGANVYEYAGASPINKIDPSGLQSIQNADDWIKQRNAPAQPSNSIWSEILDKIREPVSRNEAISEITNFRQSGEAQTEAQIARMLMGLPVEPDFSVAIGGAEGEQDLGRAIMSVAREILRRPAEQSCPIVQRKVFGQSLPPSDFGDKNLPLPSILTL